MEMMEKFVAVPSPDWTPKYGIAGSFGQGVIPSAGKTVISYENGKLDISSACKMCKLCVKKGPAGAATVTALPSTKSVRSTSERTSTDVTLGILYDGSSRVKEAVEPLSTVLLNSFVAA